MDYTPQTERDKRIDTDARLESEWHQRRREQCPNTAKAMDAVWARLDVELNERTRGKLEALGASHAIMLRHSFEMSDEDLAEQLQIIEGL